MNKNIIIGALVLLIAVLLYFTLPFSGKENKAGFNIIHSKLVLNNKDNEKYFVSMKDDDIKEGPYEKFIPAKNRTIKGQYKDNERHGVWTETYNDGIVKVLLYNNGKLVGQADLENGELLNKTDENGNNTGLYMLRKNRVSPNETGVYTNGKKEGLWVEEGSIPFSNYLFRAEGEYKNDKKEGIWKVIYQDREVTSRKIMDTRIEYDLKFREDKLVDVLCCYPDTVDKGDFNEGTGTLKTYYPNGVLREVAHYKNGVLHGTDTTFNNNELPEFANSFLVKNYDNGIEDGPYIFFMNENKKHIEGQLKKGKIHGTWNFYEQDSLGNNVLTAREIYDNGVQLKVEDSKIRQQVKSPQPSS